MKLIKWVMLSLVLSGIIGLTTGSELSLQWAQGVSGKLTRGDTISYNGYSVVAVDFPSPVISDKYQNVPADPVQAFVGLNVLKNGSIIGTAVLGSGESYVTPDNELRVTVTGLPSSESSEWLYESYSPWATVELDPRGTPSLDVLINTNSDNYTSASDTDIIATLEIQNTGTADAMNVEMNIFSGLEVTSGSLKNDYPIIKKGDSVTETVAFKPPYVLEQTEYPIFVNVSWYDVMNEFFSQDAQNAVTIAPEPKSTSLSISKSVDNKIYLGDSALVSIMIKNHRKDDLNNISITDTPPPGFSLIGNTTLHWIADIPAGGDWDIHYLIKPDDSQVDAIDLPSAVAEFTIQNENYSIQSSQPNIKVYGPKIVLTKQADVPEINPGDTVTMTVVAQNTGNTPTKVIVNDTLPENATLISGNTTYETFLGTNENASFSYSIRIADPPITLPPANASYFEPGNKGGKVNAVSQEVIINKKVPVVLPQPTPVVTISPDPTPEPTPVPMATPVPTNTPDVKEFKGSNDINDILDFLFACDNSSVNPTIKSTFCTEGIQ